MKNIIFIIGGCRSGKSRYALNLADQISEDNKIFIATCVPGDEEMKQRVLLHQKERSAQWKTLEVPVLLPKAINDISGKTEVVLVDCLTLWLNNIFTENDHQETIRKQIQQLSQSLGKVQCPVILVSNEVGAGIVPENKLARRFRDVMGFVNQTLSDISDQVIWMIAGIPVTIKGPDNP